MIPNPYKEYETFLLGIYNELTAKDTPYRFGYRMYEAGLLRPTLRISVASKGYGRALTAEVNHHDTREAYIEHYHNICRQLRAAEVLEDKKVMQPN